MPNQLDEIIKELEKGPETPIVIPTLPTNIPEVLAQEISDLRVAIESILIWLKITGRFSEAQYNFVFGHVSEIKKGDDEAFEIFLTRSAMELEAKMKSAGLI